MIVATTLHNTSMHYSGVELGGGGGGIVVIKIIKATPTTCIGGPCNTQLLPMYTPLHYKIINNSP